MRLVKAGRIIEDRFVRVLDEAPVPEGAAVVLPATRLLADARDLVLRQAPTGVIWPNDRKIAELAPYLDWIALVALVFPTFRDGRAYSQARLLRERYQFRGELRATGQVLRDQLLFLQRAGFDAFEGHEGRRCGGLRRGRAPLQRVLSADRGRPREHAHGPPRPWRIAGPSRPPRIRRLRSRLASPCAVDGNGVPPYAACGEHRESAG